MKKNDFVYKWQKEQKAYQLFFIAGICLFVAYLMFILWASKQLSTDAKSMVNAAAILALLGTVLWRSRRLEKAMACPLCRKGITGMKANLAIATGRCPNCGEQILNE